MSLDPILLAHIDPDVAVILKDLDARLMAIPAPTPPFDPSSLQSQISALDVRVTKLEGTPIPVPPPNHPPVWLSIPPVTFNQGAAASFSLAPFVSDSDVGDVVTISLLSGTLPAGVTLDAPNKRLVYNGTSPVSPTQIVTLNADDGKIP